MAGVAARRMNWQQPAATSIRSQLRTFRPLPLAHRRTPSAAMGTVRENLLEDIVVEEPTSAITPEHFVTLGGLRYVLPYYFDFKLHAKKRMAGQTLVDLFATEFTARNR